MKRITQLEIVMFAIGFVGAAALFTDQVSAEMAISAGIGLVGGVLGRFRGRFRGRAPGAIAVAIGFFVATLCGAISRDEPAPLTVSATEKPTDSLLELRVADGPRNRRGGGSYIVDVTTVDRRPHPTLRSKLWVPEGFSPLKPGDEVELFARCRVIAGDPFGRPSAAIARGFSVSCRALEPAKLKERRGGIDAILTERRTRLESRLRKILGRRAGAPIAMLTGNRTWIAHSETRAHQRAGTAHLLAISGLHFGALAALTWWLAGLVLGRSRRIARRWGTRRPGALAVLVVMASYLLFVGAPVSATRAFVAIAALVAAILFQRRPSIFVALALASIVMLADAPGLVHQLGFQLSFLATLVIGLFWHRLPDALQYDPYRFERSRVADFARRTGAFVVMSWLATAVTAPVLLGATGELSLCAFVTNLFAVPIVSFLLFPALLVAAVVSEFDPVLAGWILRPVASALLELTNTVEWWAEIPGAVATPGVAPRFWVWTAVIAVLGVAAARLDRRALIAALSAIALASGIWHLDRESARWRLHFIPVGQGDAVLLESPDRDALLIDAGGSRWGRDPGRHVVVPYLRRVGITRLDRLIVTHADTDHAGGVPAVLEEVEVAHLMTEPGATGIDGVSIERWSDDGSRNDRSLVVTLRWRGATILLPGDVEAAAEYRWLDRRTERATVVKVPHHGSKTSSTPEFVSTLDPRVAVVSAGRHNRFGHPHFEVVRRYEARGTEVLSTARHGLVLIDVRADGTVVTRAARAAQPGS